MTYRFAVERADYSDFATGRVIESMPGQTAFPVRPADEIVARALTIHARAGGTGRLALYDPCCGVGALLTTVAFRHGERLRAVIGSDSDATLLPLAARNLALLTPAGLGARRAVLAALLARFGKEAHAGALASADRLADRLAELSRAGLPATRTFTSDALDPVAPLAALGPGAVDLVVTDVPYGRRSGWTVSEPVADADPLGRLLEALLPVLAPGAVVAIASSKAQRARHDAFRQVGRWQVGTRRVLFLTPVSGP